MWQEVQVRSNFLAKAGIAEETEGKTDTIKTKVHNPKNSLSPKLKESAYFLDILFSLYKKTSQYLVAKVSANKI